MTSGGARRGRRDNGLVATNYSVAGDVDPWVGDHLLDVLAAQGIAAYLQPASDPHPVIRAIPPPAQPADRLFVDSDHLDAARDYLTHLDPQPDPDTQASLLDEAFQRIVAGYHDEADVVTWPAAEDLPHGPGRARPAGRDARPASTGRAGTALPDGTPLPDGTALPDDPAPRPDGATPRGEGTTPRPDGAMVPDQPTGPSLGSGHTPGPGFDPDGDASPTGDPDPATGPGPGDGAEPDRATPSDQRPPAGFGLTRWTGRPVRERTGQGGTDDEPSLLDGLDTFGAGLPDDDDEDFTPPPPPPLPRLSISTVAAVLAIVGGVILLFEPDLLPLGSGAALALAVCGVLGGFIALVWRLRPGDEDDEDDPMGGAVV